VTRAAPRSARGVALAALARIRGGAYANLVVPALLERSGLDERDRRFVTDLVYGTTRMQRACDHLVDRFLLQPAVDPEVRDALRLGAYQLAFGGTPPHAAVGETVAEVPKRVRGLVNAVLRKVASAPTDDWPDDATRLSYPDWIVRQLVDELGRERALAALEQMNAPAAVHERDDGYVQDPASEAVAAFAAGACGGVRPSDNAADLCAAPGGKATAIAHAQPRVVAAVDLHPGRARLIAANAARTGTSETVATVVGDATRPPLRAGAFDRVLVDAPCTGLGVLRRRPDARWRVRRDDVGDLAALQRDLLRAAIELLAPHALLVYSVCTLTAEEGPGIDRWLSGERPDLVAVPPPGPPWEPCGRGARVLPQSAGTDGMFVLGLTAVGG
jgi:16S rRNA (cytosine967-C5)-methyltransferase